MDKDNFINEELEMTGGFEYAWFDEELEMAGYSEEEIGEIWDKED